MIIRITGARISENLKIEEANLVVLCELLDSDDEEQFQNKTKKNYSY